MEEMLGFIEMIAEEDILVKNLISCLSLMAKIIKCKCNWNIDELMNQVNQVYESSQSVQHDLVLKNDFNILSAVEAKSLLFGEENIIYFFEESIANLLGFYRKTIENLLVERYGEKLDDVNKLCKILKVIEKAQIITPTMKDSIQHFLLFLLSILTNLNEVDFIKQGHLYQFTAKLIGSFKKIKYAKDFLFIEINKRLKIFAKMNMQENMMCVEVLALLLTVLNEILEYNLEKTFVNDPKLTKRCSNLRNDIAANLRDIQKSCPSYTFMIIKNCLHLL